MNNQVNQNNCMPIAHKLSKIIAKVTVTIVNISFLTIRYSLKATYLLVLALLFSFRVSAQDSLKRETTIYTFILNQVPENFKYPAVGIVNLAEGNQHGLQVGFSNINDKNFEGVQVGFTNTIGAQGKGFQFGFVNASRLAFEGIQLSNVNMVGKNTKGLQIGFFNGSKEQVEGGQLGFVNFSGKYTKGLQIAYVNYTKDWLEGPQIGFVNFVGGNAKGPQIGFVNYTKDSLNGLQLGFVNVVSNKSNGSQIGFVNTSVKTLKGSQLGFVNIADSIQNGVPLGFISIVRKGGFKAIELSYNELYTINAAVKFGVPVLYTSFGIGFNQNFTNQFAVNYGIGSNLFLTKSLAFNPEINFQNSIDYEKKHQESTSLTPQFAYTFKQRIALIAGPTLVWQHLHSRNEEGTLYQPNFSLYSNNMDAHNNLHIGAKIGVRFLFK